MFRVFTEHGGIDGLPSSARLHGLLCDRCRGEARREIRGLVLAYREDIPRQIGATESPGQLSVLRQRVLLQLTEERGLDLNFASWTFDTWARVLGRHFSAAAHSPAPASAAGNSRGDVVSTAQTPPPIPRSIGDAVVARNTPSAHSFAPASPVVSPPPIPASAISGVRSRFSGGATRKPQVAIGPTASSWRRVAFIGLVFALAALFAWGMGTPLSTAEAASTPDTSASQADKPVVAEPSISAVEEMNGDPILPDSFAEENDQLVVPVEARDSSALPDGVVSAITVLVDSSLTLAMGEDGEAYVALMTGELRYFGKLARGREEVLRDWFEYRERWPKRRFVRTAPPAIAALDEHRIVVEYPFAWEVYSPDRMVRRKGVSWRRMVLTSTDDAWLISEIEERVRSREP